MLNTQTKQQQQISCQDVFSYTIPKTFGKGVKQQNQKENVGDLPVITESDNVRISIEKKIEEKDKNEIEVSKLKLEEIVKDLSQSVKQEITGVANNNNLSIQQKCVKIILFLIGALISGVLVWSIKQFS